MVVMKFGFPRRVFPALGLVLLISGLIASAAAVLRSTELRRKAAEIQGSQLLFKGPQKVNVGEKFTVDLVLDTTTDAQYTISGVDAIVSYQGATLFDVWPGKIFDSYPTFCVPRPPCADGIKDDSGRIVICDPAPGIQWCPPQSPSALMPPPPIKPCGGIAGVICPQGYECVYDNGSTEVPYPDAQGVCQIAGQKKLLNPVTISGVKNYSVNDKGYFNGFTGQGVFATLTFVAGNPGKVTIGFVYKGPSATDDTNINGFLANQPVSLQKPQERLVVAPASYGVEVVAGLTPTPTPTPSCIPRPPCTDGVKDPISGRIIICDPAPGTNWCPPKPTITPTSTPSPAGKLSFTLFDTSGAPVRQAVKIFAGSGLSNDGLVLLGQTETNASGAGDVWIKNEYLGKPWTLYAQTLSHLIRAAYPQRKVVFESGQTVLAKFDNLVPGDIYVAEGQLRQDGVINNFDAADLFRQWGPYAQIQILPPPPPAPADLNADGTINNRDLAILLSNFGKRGDNPTGMKLPPAQ